MNDRDLLQGARASKLLAERLADDPLLNFQLHSRQQLFVENKGREVWMAAANRAGKSDVLAASTGSFLRFGLLNPQDLYRDGRFGFVGHPVAVLIASPTFDMLRTIFQPKLFDNGCVPPGQPHPPFIPAHEIAEFNERKRFLQLKNGSIAHFGAYEQGRELFQGKAVQLVAFDEVPPLPIYQESAIRVEAGTSLLIRGALTLLPDAKKFETHGHWFYGQKVVPWMRKILPREQLDIITASIYDNKHISRDEIERLEAIYPPGSIDNRIRLQGELLPGMLGAVAYPSFDRQIHVNPKLTGGMLRPDFRRPLILCFDSNIEPATATVLQDFNGFLRVLDEIVLEVGTTKDIADAFILRFPAHGAELHIHGDATSQRRSAQTGKSDYDLLLEVFRALPYPVRVFVPRSNPPVRDRVNALNAKLIGRGGVVGMEVPPHCVEIIADFESVQRSADGGLKKVKDKRDPYYRRTHLTDGLGYYVSFRYPVGTEPNTRRQSSHVPIPGHAGMKR
jgi:phage terminase large subunit-like protein